MELNLEREREEDGRRLAEVPELPGVLAHGGSANEAMAGPAPFSFGHAPVA